MEEVRLMAEEQEQMQDWQERQKSFRPGGLDDLTQPERDALRALGDPGIEWIDKLNTLKEPAAAGDAAAREEFSAALGYVRDQLKPDDTFVEDPLNTTTVFTDPEGRAAVRETDQRGTVREQHLSKEESDSLKAEVDQTGDKIEESRSLRVRARTLRSLADDARGEGLQDAADKLDADAKAMHAKAETLTNEVKESVAREDWSVWGLAPLTGVFPERVSKFNNQVTDKVIQAVELTKQKAWDKLFTLATEQMTASESYQLSKELGEKEYEEVSKKLTKIASDKATELGWSGVTMS
jgi:hypothetical protein